MSHQKMPVAYVAGPYRGRTGAAIELNIQSARQVGLQVARKGWSPLVPHANTGHLDLVDPQVGDQFWLAATMELMRRCDAVALAPGWDHSDGTAAEIHEARRIGLPVFETVHALPCADTWRQQEEIQLQPAE